jgi:hypothetical protein
MSGIHSKVFYNNRLSKVASLTLINSTKGSMVFLIEKRAVPGIAEKMDDLKESGEFNSFCLHLGDAHAEAVMFIVERTQNPQNVFQDFDELASKWILEGN